jgi:hypothetical protein
MPTHSFRPTRPSARPLVIALALLAPLCVPAIASAAEQTSVIAPPYANGPQLAEPTGIVETPDGEIWVASDQGVCRVDQANNRLGTQAVGPCDGNETAVTGPQQMDFDPRTNDFYVAEGDSGGNGVIRMHWQPGNDPSTAATEVGYIDEVTKIIDTLPGGDRVWGLTLSPTGPPVGGESTMEVNFTSRDSAAVRRIERPDLIGRTGGPAAPLAANQVEIAGTPIAPGATSLAWFDGVPEPGGEEPEGELYIAEDTGVTVVEEPETDADPSNDLRAVPVVPAPNDPSGTISLFPGGIPSTIAADEENNRLYAGTANGNNVDQVDVFQPARDASGLPVEGDSPDAVEPEIMETYSQQDADSRGHNTITALAVDVAAFGDPSGEGRVFVGEDPELGEGFFGRITALAKTALGRPTTMITSAPRSWTNETTATFDFRASSTDATFECRFGEYKNLPAWAPCGDTGTGSETYGGPDPDQLTDGVYVFEVRAIDSVGTGEPVRRTFTVDTAAPAQPEVTVPTPDPIVEDAYNQGGTARLDFSADDTYFCKLDQGAALDAPADSAGATECSAPATYTGLQAGGWDDANEVAKDPKPYRFTVWATDSAGNMSAPTSVEFGVQSKEPPDSDGDGLYNHLDDCSDEGGIVDANGCPKDTDGDGVVDNDDSCRNEGDAGHGLTPDGCPKPAPAADLSITRYTKGSMMTGLTPAPIVEDGAVAMAVTVTNDGPEQATGAVLRQTLSGGGLRFHRAKVVGGGRCIVPSATVTSGPGVVNCDLGAIPAGGSKNVELTVTPLDPGRVDATARATATEPDPNLSNNARSTSMHAMRRPSCMGKKATIVGTGEPDVITGTAGRDVIAALGGNDIVRAGSGQDYVCGGDGVDLLLGEAGRDTLHGGGGVDQCNGGPGRNTLRSC